MACDSLTIMVEEWLRRHFPAAARPYLRSLQFTVTPLLGQVLRRMPGSSLAFGPPRGLAPTLAGYAHDHGGPGTCYVEVHPSSAVRRTPPRMANGGAHPSFGAEMERSLPPAGVAVIGGGRVLSTTGAVISPDDRLIADVSDTFLSANPWANSHLIQPRLPPVRRVSGSVGVLTTYRSNIYYHWLLDTLPRLHLLQTAGIPFEKLVVGEDLPYQRQSIQLLGIDPVRIIAERGLHLQADSLLVPSMPGRTGNPPKWACEFLRGALMAGVPSDLPASSRLFVSREHSRSRLITNEHEIFEALRPYGFVKLRPEDLTFAEQIDAFSRAEFVVAPHGSALANLVFCREGTHVVELFSPNYVNVMYWALSNQVGLDYSCVLGTGRAAPSAHRGRRIHEDMTIDTLVLRHLLEDLLDE
jgi:capsular polysaccharide biosynthesis protein